MRPNCQFWLVCALVLYLAATLSCGSGGNPAPASSNPPTGASSPTIASVSPTSGPTAGGTAVTLTGTNFQMGASVFFSDAVAASVIVTSSSQITAVTPAHAAGVVSVQVRNPDGQTGTMVGGFNYTAPAPAPTITSVSPTFGPTAGGTSVTITGTNFQAGATVSFGGTPAPSVSVTSTTQITTTTPAHAEGSVDVRVTNPDGQTATLSGGFLFVLSNPSGSIIFTVDPGSPKQTWRAWTSGCCAGPKFEVNTVCTNISDPVMSGIVNDVADDLRLNGFRIGQHEVQGVESTANDNSDPFNINQAAFDPGFNAPALGPCQNTWQTDRVPRFITPIRNKTLARGEPFELHINFVYDGFSLLPSWWQNNPDEMSEVFEAYWRWFHNLHGYYPDFAGFNEPDNAYFVPNHMGPFTKSLGDRLAALGAGSKALAQPETVTPSSAGSAWDIVVSTPGAASRISRLTFHDYDYGTKWPPATGIASRNALISRASAVGAELGMTELCCRAGWNGSYDHGLDLVRDMYLNITEANVSVWQAANFFLPCVSAGCVVGSGTREDLINLEPNLFTYYLQPHYWVIRQFMRYIRPGYVRVATSCSGCGTTADRGPDLKALAWKRPNGSIVVNIINDSGSAKSVTITGLPPGNYDLHKLDPTLCVTSGGKNRCTPQSAIVAAPPDIVLMIPTNGVWTLSQQ